MTKRIGLWTMIAMLAFLAACAPGEGTHEHEAPPAEAVMDIPPVATLIAHRVADYDAWKKAFDGHMQARKDAGCLGHHINRGADDPNVVFIYCPATDVDRLGTFLTSPDLVEAMKESGVQSAPKVIVMRPMSENFIPDQMLAGILIAHTVEDYDTWRAAYDEFDEYRRQNGIVGHAVHQKIGDPNQVIVYHQANDMDTLRAFVDSAELKETMKRGGVVGAPDIEFVQFADFAEY